jgi:hypothetical protein
MTPYSPPGNSRLQDAIDIDPDRRPVIVATSEVPTVVGNVTDAGRGQRRAGPLT